MTESNKRFYIESDDMEVGMHVVPVDNHSFSYDGLPFKVTAIDFPFIVGEPTYKNLASMTFDTRRFKFKRTDDNYVKAHLGAEVRYEGYKKSMPSFGAGSTFGEIITDLLTGENNTNSIDESKNGENKDNA
jgi:hypothetical protein